MASDKERPFLEIIRKVDDEGYERHEFIQDPAELLAQTGRGFPLLKFRDRSFQRCSLQQSSLATEGAIWLGVDVDLQGA